ncbi:ABC transporter, permease protein [Catonella morbi ATCC 51271]|uniref:ABC transporter, permease protein n=1 Tax=Catonella morbi ATCC 51271 TaxID=592026 RepID=V2Y3Y1_9FIRM|nr:carbohydrate ABC transporter permease [Catonella morbi]ESL03643.1 ABC transporter, permease protein [Catonella morbi ATCC 51271]
MTKKQKILVYTFLVIVSLLSIFPIYWMACAATNTSVDIMRGKLIPGGYLIENFKSLIGNQDLGRAFVNSVRNSVLLTLFSMIICSIAGYGFEVYHQKSKDILFTVLLTAMMLPFVAIMIPLFTMFSKAGMVNSWLAFMLPGLSTPFLIMMFRQAARSFPKEIIEAARMDGLSEVGIFFTMFVPTMRSTYGAAVTVTFMSTWNSYLWPKVIFQKNESTTMPMLVANLLGAYTVDYGMLMLGVLIATLPTAVVFFMLQKQFAEGITGAIK